MLSESFEELLAKGRISQLDLKKNIGWMMMSISEKHKLVETGKGRANRKMKIVRYKEKRIGK